MTYETEIRADPATGPAQPLVALEGVTKRFPGVVANDAVTLEFHPGEVHALLGENGAGKSTLISMLAGVQQPDEGRILIEGVPTKITSPKHALSLGIGTVYQHRMLVPTLTVAENLQMGAPWYRRPDRAAIREKFAESCRAFGIDIDIDRVVGELSLGEQQQVEIIRALWRGGKLLVLDEPTAMLSPAGVRELGRMMGRMRDAGVSIIFITHHLSEAVEFGNRVSVLRSGRVAGAMSADEVAALTPEATRARIVDLMFGAGVEGDTKIERRARRDHGERAFEVVGLSGKSQKGDTGFSDVTFHVQEGEIFGVAGVDGNGQTPLAEAIAGQIPCQGDVLLEGRALGRADVAKRYRLGLRYATDDRLGEGTVASLPISLNMVLKQIGRPPYWRGGVQRDALIDAHAESLFEEFDVRAPSIHTPIGKLSGGNIQKVLLARELSGAAKVVVYNKPTHGLDLKNIETTRRRIRDGADNGIATVLISTDLEEILSLSDRIGVMVRGRMVGVVPNGPDARKRVGAMMAGESEE
ncbi:putative B6 ABC transporter ATP-binding protein [Pseudooceanicola nanhaiensis]|uniref:putative B6 ABC transporter ATP-binding protein n=1 Tax=Pseudooceanicola nanhaiensis TaxID=375761 RepID=UPI001CD5E835|nr:ABC transporter ATP-binding protein [Pseudooceanicola nanhaiensis]MCA0921279.1 ABC transporter ATP-binding protein [Pseudooceanicola nanhaiensis]